MSGELSVETAKRARLLSDRADLPVVAAVVAVLAWGVGPLFVRAMTLSPPSIVFYRLLIGGVLMAAMARFTGGRFDRETVRLTALPGALFGISMVFGFWSFKTTSIANASIIGALTPAFVLVVASRTLGERPSRHQLGGAALGFVGVAIVVLGAGGTGGASLTGDLLAFVNLVLWAGYLLLAKRIRSQGQHAGVYIASVFAWSALIVCPWSLVVSDDLGAIDGKNLLLLLGMASLPGLVGHSLMAWAQRDLAVGVVSLFGLASPIVSAVGAWLVYEQGMTAWQLVGAALVLVGLLAVVLEQRAAMLT